MSPKEFLFLARKLCADIGPRACLNLGIYTHTATEEEPFFVSLDDGRGLRLSVHAASYEQALAKIAFRYSEDAPKHREKMIERARRDLADLEAQEKAQ